MNYVSRGKLKNVVAYLDELCAKFKQNIMDNRFVMIYVKKRNIRKKKFLQKRGFNFANWQISSYKKAQ